MCQLKKAIWLKLHLFYFFMCITMPIKCSQALSALLHHTFLPLSAAYPRYLGGLPALDITSSASSLVDQNQLKVIVLRFLGGRLFQEGGAGTWNASKKIKNKISPTKDAAAGENKVWLLHTQTAIDSFASARGHKMYKGRTRASTGRRSAPPTSWQGMGGLTA